MYLPEFIEIFRQILENETEIQKRASSLSNRYFYNPQNVLHVPAIWEINSVSDGDVRSFIHYREFVFHVFRSFDQGLVAIDSFLISLQDFSPTYTFSLFFKSLNNL